MIVIVKIEDIGSDVLLVTYTDGTLDRAGALVQKTARGWVSATTHHYDPAAYDASGNLAALAVPRAMTPAEVTAYARSLIPGPVAPKPIAFA